jgi:hypothetical protein
MMDWSGEDKFSELQGRAKQMPSEAGFLLISTLPRFFADVQARLSHIGKCDLGTTSVM